MKLGREELLAMLKMLGMTKAEEIDCGEFLDRVGGFLEKLGPDGTPPAGHEELVHHLQFCPECLEEFEALLRAYKAELDG